MTGWDALYALVGPLVIPPMALRRVLQRRPYPQFWQRLVGSTIKHASPSIPPADRPVWFHGVSMGEIIMLSRLIRAFQAVVPHRGVCLSTTTTTGFAAAEARLPDVPRFYFPLDLSWAIARTLDALDPALVVLAEAELWPNLLAECRARRIPVALVNARMSDRSFRRYRWARPITRRLLSKLSLIAAQTDDFAARFLDLGAEPATVVVTGSIKFDGLETDRSNPNTVRLRRLFGVRDGDVVWVAGSTSAPEEGMVLTVYEELIAAGHWVKLIIVPRHPERFEEVAAMVAERGLPWMRRSELQGGPARSDAVIVVDTLGELAHVWGLADLGFVGGSFARRGGQSMLEPAAYGVATFFGPHVWNYRDAAQALVHAGAARQVHSLEEMRDVTRQLLADSRLRREMGERARQYVASHRGAAERTARYLSSLLGHHVATTRAA